MRRVAALILAAGRGTRFAPGPDESKVTALLDGTPLVHHVAAAALASRARPVLVVTGHAAAHVEAALAGLDLAFVRNPAYADGLSTSVKAGLAALPAESDAAVVLLADMPRVGARLIDQLVTAFDAADAATQAVVPIHGGKRGNPVLIGRALFAALETVTGDHGARGLLDAADSHLLEIPVDDAGVAFDVDTRGMLAAAHGRLS
jgi:molybdenum cofactor cytidylyltransferase